MDTSIKAFEDALVRNGIVQADAIDNPEGYDFGQTKLHVFAAYEETLGAARSRIATLSQALELIRAGLAGHQHVDTNRCAFCKIMRLCDEALNTANATGQLPAAQNGER